MYHNKYSKHYTEKYILNTQAMDSLQWSPYINDKLSDECLDVIAEDIRHTENLGMDCDKKEWLKLLDRIEEVI